ncbi:MAG: hypothetical protein ACRDUY_10360 [Nitriliruptorales bacterium]
MDQVAVGLLDAYDHQGFFDEVFVPDGTHRPHYRTLVERLHRMSPKDMARRERLRDSIFRTAGITFTIYGDGGGLERSTHVDWGEGVERAASATSRSATVATTTTSPPCAASTPVPPRTS